DPMQNRTEPVTTRRRSISLDGPGESERPERRRRLQSPCRPVQRQCSICSRPGHNRNTCPDKDMDTIPTARRRFQQELISGPNIERHRHRLEQMVRCPYCNAIMFLEERADIIISRQHQPNSKTFLQQQEDLALKMMREKAEDFYFIRSKQIEEQPRRWNMAKLESILSFMKEGRFDKAAKEMGQFVHQDDYASVIEAGFLVCNHKLNPLDDRKCNISDAVLSLSSKGVDKRMADKSIADQKNDAVEKYQTEGWKDGYYDKELINIWFYMMEAPSHCSIKADGVHIRSYKPHNHEVYLNDNGSCATHCLANFLLDQPLKTQGKIVPTLKS
ncbi:hypothetical protein BX616_004746, partial [Lobosporangium transversale]